MRVILLPIGSAGDVFPFVGLARVLRERGHDVVIITSGHFQRLCEDEGFRFRACGSDEEFREVMSDPDLWHPIRGFRTVMSALADQAGLMRAIEAELDATSVVVSHPLGFAARVLQEARGVRLATLVLQPSMFRSYHEGPYLVGGRRTTDFPRWVQRAFWRVADHLAIDRFVRPVVEPLRRSLGLKPAGRYFKEWVFSTELVVGLFPEWFERPQPDWPRHTQVTSFPLADAFGDGAAMASVPENRPLVFTPGSANVHAAAFFEAAAGACAELGRPGLLLTRHAEQLPRHLPPDVQHMAFAPLSRLLPHCSALVHHGGIGTTAAGLAAGVPQLLMPLSHDQPDNAARVIRLGVGASLAPRRFTAGNVARALRQLLESEKVRESCDLCLHRTTPGLVATADILERSFAVGP
jgi:rhamnosyltransferase subunit B